MKLAYENLAQRKRIKQQDMNQNQFIFGESLSDKLMKRINLREVDKIAKEWFHPYYSLINLSKETVTLKSGILGASKKNRESYAVSILVLALQESTNKDWWIHIPDVEPPDGYIATFHEELMKGKPYIKGGLREIEVVEHRSNDKTILERLKGKILDGSYNPDTVFVCLTLVPCVYDFKKLSEDLKKIIPKQTHAFVVMHGVQFSSGIPKADLRLTAAQLLPEFISVTFDLKNSYKDFKKKFDIGQEERLIEGNMIHYGTRNLKFHKK